MPYRPSAEVEAIVNARHGDPFAFLGMHQSSAGIYVRTFLPDAESVSVVESATGEVAARAERIHPAGMFVASMADRREPFRYRLRVRWGGHEQEFDDVYRFGPVLGELDLHLLVEGNHLASYRKLGAHPIVHEGVEGVVVRGLGAERAAGQRRRRFQRLGRQAHADAAAARRRSLGDFRARPAPGPSLQIRADRPRRRPAAAEGRSLCRAGRAPAGHRLDRRAAVAPCLAGRVVDRRALAAAGARRADLDL